jgi:outer membrane immunogenic protein
MQVGWTLGAGVEYAIGKSWSVKAEYLHYDLGNTSIVGNSTIPSPFQIRYDFSTAANVINFGLNYRF